MPEPAAFPQPLATIVATVAAGVLALALGEKTRLPSILFFLLFGILLGPEFANVVQPAIFRTDFPHYISLMVALILFEGGTSLRFAQFQEISAVLRKLLTIGVVTTLVSVTLLARLLAGLSWTHAALFASIMVVTGPTVVQPILRRVHVKDSLQNLLKWEAILIDPLGVVLAVLLFEILLIEDLTLAGGLGLFVARIGLGVGFGIAAGWLMHLGLTKTWMLRLEGEELGGLFVLGMNLLFFGLAEWLLPDSGLACATAAGIYLGNKRFAFKDQILHFKLQITLFALSILFILLSSNLPVHATGAILPQGVALLTALILVVRPLSVFLSTRGEGKLQLRDRLFIASFAPRGIVSASLASLFAIAFKERALAGSSQFLPLAFFVIAGTIVFYAALAGVFARLLGVRQAPGRGVLIVGANAFGFALGGELKERGVPVAFIDTNRFFCQRARELGFTAFQGSAFDRDFIDLLDLKGIGQAVAATPNYEVNVLSCQNLTRYLGRHSVYRVWGKGDAWEEVAADAFDRSWGRPFVIGGKASIQDAVEVARLGSTEVAVKQLEEPLKVEPESLAGFGIDYPLFAWAGEKAIFPVPGASFPAESEVIHLVRSAGAPTSSAT